MSEAQRAVATVGGSEAVKAVEHQPAPEHQLPPQPGRSGPVALMGLGGLLAGVIASTALLALPGGQGSDFEIKTVAKDDKSWETTWEGKCKATGGTGKLQKLHGTVTFKGKATPDVPYSEEGEYDIEY